MPWVSKVRVLDDGYVVLAADLQPSWTTAAPVVLQRRKLGKLERKLLAPSIGLSVKTLPGKGGTADKTQEHGQVVCYKGREGSLHWSVMKSGK